ncbi:substrate-binding periplasmic protein [Rugamonas apoptosis]|uniref:Transporter substrate-binding domain-containing protein n=1 Tax=Rugamonas apoptosis TaxID=2758570 RepID=A0A7W2FCK4_9BURK|nr:transporter substrate-binding domain-containing protein [Rugamonas apoptosis]MBA5689180.1 transporter substrate-binding domain-containing protein [Rugamonas apoptosis]
MSALRYAMLITTCLWPAFALAQAAAPLIVGYSLRPPYTIAAPDGSLSGLLGTPATQAFRAAGIAAEWRAMPPNRQLAMVKNAATPSCAVGWAVTPERAHFAKFTRPIYRDHGWVALANVKFAAYGDTTLLAALQRKDTRVLVKDNYSYGAQIDQMLAELHPITAVTTTTVMKMAHSVSSGMVDLMFAPEEEARYVLEHAGEQSANLRLLRFSDIRSDNTRHIMCGLAVPDEIIERLNRVISFR